ncbi:MAG: DUF4345 family protein [Parvibaculaceae bacterium]|nr:DUF4345 family protein [Parvibaculaceae bacterium]
MTTSASEPSSPTLQVSDASVPAFVVLRLILALCGAGIVFLGLNVGFGGIATLGWQGSPDFVVAADAYAYSVQDSHVRFLGGVWLGVGGLFLLGALLFKRLTSVLIVLCGLIFVGGLVRMSTFDVALLLGSDIAPSLFAELFIFPGLALWIRRAQGVFSSGSN